MSVKVGKWRSDFEQVYSAAAGSVLRRIGKDMHTGKYNCNKALAIHDPLILGVMGRTLHAQKAHLHTWIKVKSYLNWRTVHLKKVSGGVYMVVG